MNIFSPDPVRKIFLTGEKSLTHAHKLFARVSPGFPLVYRDIPDLSVEIIG
jgi:hypothetical protein